jgi:hypothetical protein
VELLELVKEALNGVALFVGLGVIPLSVILSHK